MKPQTITLGMMLIVTGGRDPISAAAQELSVYLACSYHEQARAWVAAAEHERLHGVEACRLAVQRAAAALEEARAMAERVRSAERAARRGLDVMLDKLAAPQE